VVVLFGDPSSRPDGLERDLLRSGLQVSEADDLAQLPARPSMLLVTCEGLDESHTQLGDAFAVAREAGAQVVVLINSDDVDQLVVAARAGADDAILLPGESAHLLARIRARLVSPRISAHGPGANDLRLFNALQQVAVELHRDEMLHALVRTLSQALEVRSVTCILHHAAGGSGRLVAATDAPKLRDVEADLDRWPEAAAALANAETVFIADTGSSTVYGPAGGRSALNGPPDDIATAAAIPIMLLGRAVGTVVLRTRDGEAPLVPSQLEFAEHVVVATSRLLETEERRGAIARRQSLASSVDPLTGCGTLDALDRRIREEFERARRYDVAFGLVLLDVDGMRRINERLGRDGGHRVLGDLGRLLQRELRAPDFVARYGGEEFLLLLPETDLEGARNAVHRIRARLDGSGLDEQHLGVSCTLSAGIASFPHPGIHKPEDMFALVERALVNGKADGGERIGSAA
jgi:diguanylate cyclase (GGDEF)-like protein